MENIKETALLLLGDILPTGAFCAVQALRNPKVAGIISRQPYAGGLAQATASEAPLRDEDMVLTFAIVGLGPVGLVGLALAYEISTKDMQCAAISLLYLLVREHHHIKFNIVAIDLLPSRQEKMQAIYDVLPTTARGNGSFRISSPENARSLVDSATSGRGCNAVLEVVGNNSALSLAYSLVQPFGVISSVGVHQAPPLPFTGRDVYNKNVSLEFGRTYTHCLPPLITDPCTHRLPCSCAVPTRSRHPA
jgi:threonine dehydrogenase-like Zn-dependent dehydrogenase